MKAKIWRIINNDVLFWIFFIILCLFILGFILKKEGIKITVTFSEPYKNRELEFFGE